MTAGAGPVKPSGDARGPKKPPAKRRPPRRRLRRSALEREPINLPSDPSLQALNIETTTLTANQDLQALRAAVLEVAQIKENLKSNNGVRAAAEARRVMTCMPESEISGDQVSLRELAEKLQGFNDQDISLLKTKLRSANILLYSDSDQPNASPGQIAKSLESGEVLKAQITSLLKAAGDAPEKKVAELLVKDPALHLKVDLLRKGPPVNVLVEEFSKTGVRIPVEASFMSRLLFNIYHGDGTAESPPNPDALQLVKDVLKASRTQRIQLIPEFAETRESVVLDISRALESGLYDSQIENILKRANALVNVSQLANILSVPLVNAQINEVIDDNRPVVGVLKEALTQKAEVKKAQVTTFAPETEMEAYRAKKAELKEKNDEDGLKKLVKPNGYKYSVEDKELTGYIEYAEVLTAEEFKAEILSGRREFKNIYVSSRGAEDADFADLDPAWFYGITITDSEMRAIKFPPKADFRGANLRGTRFVGGKNEEASELRGQLRGAMFNGACLEGTHFKLYDLTDMDCRPFEEEGKEAKKTNCDKARFEDCIMDTALFIKANLERAEFVRVIAGENEDTMIRFDHANLKGSQFIETVMPYISFFCANVSRGIAFSNDFSFANITGSNWMFNDLSFTRFKRAFALKADTSTPYARANFSKANLSGVSFEEAELEGACFLDYTSNGVDKVRFNGANLKEALFNGAFVHADFSPSTEHVRTNPGDVIVKLKEEYPGVIEEIDDLGEVFKFIKQCAPDFEPLTGDDVPAIIDLTRKDEAVNMLFGAFGGGYERIIDKPEVAQELNAIKARTKSADIAFEAAYAYFEHLFAEVGMEDRFPTSLVENVRELYKEREVNLDEIAKYLQAKYPASQTILEGRATDLTDADFSVNEKLLSFSSRAAQITESNFLGAILEGSTWQGAKVFASLFPAAALAEANFGVISSEQSERINNNETKLLRLNAKAIQRPDYEEAEKIRARKAEKAAESADEPVNEALKAAAEASKKATLEYIGISDEQKEAIKTGKIIPLTDLHSCAFVSVPADKLQNYWELDKKDLNPADLSNVAFQGVWALNNIFIGAKFGEGGSFEPGLGQFAHAAVANNHFAMATMDTGFQHGFVQFNNFWGVLENGGTLDFSGTRLLANLYSSNGAANVQQTPETDRNYPGYSYNPLISDMNNPALQNQITTSEDTRETLYTDHTSHNQLM